MRFLFQKRQKLNNLGGANAPKATWITKVDLDEHLIFEIYFLQANGFD